MSARSDRCAPGQNKTKAVFRLPISFLLLDRTCAHHIKRFARTEHSEENLLFWLATEAFRNLRSETVLRKECRRIYREFLRPNAPLAVTLDGEVAVDLVARIERGECDHGMFVEAQNVVAKVLKSDIHLRFIGSEEHAHMCERLARRIEHDIIAVGASSAPYLSLAVACMNPISVEAMCEFLADQGRESLMHLLLHLHEFRTRGFTSSERHTEVIYCAKRYFLGDVLPESLDEDSAADAEAEQSKEKENHGHGRIDLDVLRQQLYIPPAVVTDRFREETKKGARFPPLDLSEVERRAFARALAAPSQDSLNPVYDAVWRILEHEIYPEFLRSPIFARMIEQVRTKAELCRHDDTLLADQLAGLTRSASAYSMDSVPPGVLAELRQSENQGSSRPYSQSQSQQPVGQRLSAGATWHAGYGRSGGKGTDGSGGEALDELAVLRSAPEGHGGWEHGARAKGASDADSVAKQPRKPTETAGGSSAIASKPATASADKGSKTRRFHNDFGASTHHASRPGAQQPRQRSLTRSVSQHMHKFRLLSLDQVLEDVELLDAYLLFSKREHSEENVLFYIAAQEFSRLVAEGVALQEQLHLAERVWTNYVRPGARYQLPLSGECVSHIRTRLRKAGATAPGLGDKSFAVKQAGSSHVDPSYSSISSSSPLMVAASTIATIAEAPRANDEREESSVGADPLAALFDAAVREIRTAMATDSFKRFQYSRQYVGVMKRREGEDRLRKSECRVC